MECIRLYFIPYAGASSSIYLRKFTICYQIGRVKEQINFKFS